MKNKPADTRRRYAKAIDAPSDPSSLGTVIAMDGVRHKSPDTGRTKSILWYPKAAQLVTRRQVA